MKSSLLTSGRFLALPGVLLCTLVLGLASPAAGQGFKWWQDEGYKRELGLTAEQSTRLEEIFQNSSQALRQHKEAFDREQAEFDRIVERGDDTAIMDQVSAVEQARGELNKARVMMLLRMRRTLTADQWAKFTALNERYRESRERAGNRR
ncbi:MAG: Spy/CpxP family protein refolding chaperone [Vicinamibacterales bacterium]